MRGFWYEPLLLLYRIIVLRNTEKVEDRIAELKETYGSSTVEKALAKTQEVDLEDHASAVNMALDETFGVE